MYRNISMAQRLDRIGELLAKGVFLYLKKEEEKAAKERNDNKVKADEAKSLTGDSRHGNIKAVKNSITTNHR